MILRELGHDAVLCIGQPAHAWLSGQLARQWGNGLFAGPWPRDEVLPAVEQHDVGMAAWDAEPELDRETGWPQSFTDMPLETHLALWSRAPGLALTQSRWAGLLVSMHGAHLYSRRAQEPGVAEFLAAQEALQRELVASLGVTEAQAAHNQRLLALWDWISLALCMDRLPLTVQADRPLTLAAAGEGTVTARPWPFASDRVELSVEGRVLEARYEEEAAMREALAHAPWRTLTFTVTPPA
jgi:hypothetical protein